ncbi:MAG: 16S rRNA (guanine(527)-N(7))-methyltransferase RsmG, partial [Bdellovibrio sp.]
MPAKKKDVNSPSWRIHEWFQDLESGKLEKMEGFFQELQKFNESLNLVSKKSLLEADNVHFADCIMAAKIFLKIPGVKAKTLFDFGSGNGFPGLVFSILDPELRVNLVEIDVRKCEFLKHSAHALGLKNLSILQQGVESLGENSVELAISRGFAPLSRALVITRKVFAKGGAYYHMKSEEWASEIMQIPAQVCSYWN